MTPSPLPSHRGRLLSILWLLALGAYILAGVPLASFHGDEAMQIHMSRDYVTAFMDGEPARLMTTPPYYIDSDAHLRILNGTVNRYAIGLSWHLAGYSADDLPPAPGWDWGLSYQDGVETGHRPDEALMTAARLPSALFLWGSVVVLFALARGMGPAWLPYVVSAVYALHPVILLNGRRAMQEGSLLFFGLLAVLVAAQIAARRFRVQPVSLVWWLGLAAASGLTLASKHSGIVFLAGAFGWILASELVGRREWGRVVGRLAAAGLLAVALFVALSPALWNDPLARFRDLLAVRQELIDIQISIDPEAPTSLAQRAAALVIQPFIAPAGHYELPSWGEDETFLAETRAYDRSWLSGVHYGLLLGLPLTVLALLGGVTAMRNVRSPAMAGLLVWLAVVVASLLVNPLPWQRYYLPLVPAAALLAGLGLVPLARRIRDGLRKERDARATALT